METDICSNSSLKETESRLKIKKNCKCNFRVTYKGTPISSPAFKVFMRKQLRKELFLYDEKHDGIVLRYGNIRVITPIEAKMSRKIYVTCFADVYVFHPQEGDILSGVVMKKSANHVSCTLYNRFNITFIKPEDVPSNKWEVSKVNLLDQIFFRISKIDVFEKIPHIVGDIINENTMENDVYENDDEQNRYLEADVILDMVRRKNEKKKKRKKEKNSRKTI